METQFKVCRKCLQSKLLTDFYPRSNASGVVSECKDCMQVRSAERNRLITENKISKLTSLVTSETWVIQELRRNGIPAIVGKALHHNWCDVLAYSCVGIEVKYALQEFEGGYTFHFTPAQRERGIRGQLITLVCNTGNRVTFHVFDAKDERFYKDGKLKTAITYKANRGMQGKSAVFTPGAMQEHQDAWYMVHDELERIEELLYKEQIEGLPEWLRY